jgi:hypothetical protein
MTNHVDYIAQQLIDIELDRSQDNVTPTSVGDTPSHHLSPSRSDEHDQSRPPRQRTRPSRYLQRRCNLCFGGQHAAPRANDDPQVLVQGDGNFTQKRSTNPKDPDGCDSEIRHPETVFLTREELDEARKTVETKRPPRDAATDREKRKVAETDSIEAGMHIPISVLTECEESFTAANENREKASTDLFAETGIFALLCRHDRPLFLANMTTAGEHQFYMLALLKRFFSEIPEDMTIGVLYDVACTLERSMWKWDFYPEFRHRIIWALSVFHAYGHQWVCQLVYHPRKRNGFGLTDGEGCERFWSL